QAIWNLRDTFKSGSEKRTLVMLCTSVTLPPELQHDVLVLDEPLPTVEHLKQIVEETYDSFNANREEKINSPKKELLNRAIDAICGLPAFPAEQACFMNIGKTGLNVETLWERKLQMIEQTVGLKVWRGGEKFSDIGGCANVKKFLTRVLAGESRPRSIVF